MELSTPVWSGLRLALLLAGLLAPGAALLRAVRLPRSPGLCFATSAVTLYAIALALNALGVPLSLLSLATTLAAVTAGAFFAARRQASSLPADNHEPGRFAAFTRLGALTPFMLLYWAVIGFLLLREPLAGPDVQFRWGFLPEQWLRHGTLDFYPPVSATDFRSYFWVESIPPGVASLHAWAFACGGDFAPGWTIAIAALQFLALHDLAWRAGAAAGGEPAGRLAAVLVAACPLVNWSCRLGQETGLTTLALLGLAFTLLRWRATGRTAWAIAAGLFAGLGAMTREYGLVFPALAVVALAAGRAPRATWRAFALVALPLCAAWPLRCSLRTGNPFYSLNVAGLFPVNRVFMEWIGDQRTVFGAALAGSGGWLYVLHWLALGAAPALLGWIVLTLAARRHWAAGLGAFAVAAIFALWMLSVPYTGGGIFYSLRVVSPALALGAIATAVAVSGRPNQPYFAAGVGVLLLATLPLTLLLPQNPWRVPLAEWPAPWRPAPISTAGSADEIVPAILSQHASVVLTDSPGFQTLLASHGIGAIPFWSPQADWLFDPKLTSAEATQRWRESGLHFVVLSKFAPAIAFLNRRARWNGPPFRLQVAAETAGFLLLNVDATTPSPP